MLCVCWIETQVRIDYLRMCACELMRFCGSHTKRNFVLLICRSCCLLIIMFSQMAAARDFFKIFKSLIKVPELAPLPKPQKRQNVLIFVIVSQKSGSRCNFKARIVPIVQLVVCVGVTERPEEGQGCGGLKV